MKKSFYILTCILFSFSLQSQSFTINSFSVDIDVSADGYFDVIEEINVEFHEKSRGIFRAIPYKYKISDETVSIGFENVSVDRWKFKSYREDGDFRIRIGDPDIYLEGQQRYTIRYRVVGAFLWEQDWTEFYWNLTGNEWEVNIENADFTVNFPENASIGEEDYQVYSGKSGVQDNNVIIMQSGNSLTGRTQGVLKPEEGITLAVKLPGDLIKKQENSSRFSDYNPLKDFTAIIPAGLLVLLISFWNRLGRYRMPKDVPYAHYPPDGISAAEIGTIYDNKANTRDVISLIPEWGRDGYIKARSTADSHESGVMYIERESPLPRDKPEYQHVLFDGLFKDSGVVLLSDLKEKFYSTISKTRSKLSRIVHQSDIYDQTSHRMFHNGWLIALLILSLVFGIFVIGAWGKIITGIFFIILGIAAFVIHVMRPRLSEEGFDLVKQLEGLKQFLKDSPADEMSDIVKKDDKYFEKMLPYAIAFGIDKAWINSMNGYHVQAPSWWYMSGYPHTYRSMSDFTNNFDIAKVQSVFTSVPASSQGSSGGGVSGGSSGGGFGGGGGGSW